MKINKQLTSSTNSKQVISLNKSIKQISINNNGTIFTQDKSKQANTSIIGSMLSTTGMTKNNSKINSENSGILGSSGKNYIIATSNKLVKDKAVVSKMSTTQFQPSATQVTKKENSIEKLLKYGNTQSQLQNISIKLATQQNNSNNQSQNTTEILNDKQTAEGKIPSLKNICKSKEKKYGIKDVKINLLGNNKIKIQTTSSNNQFTQNGNENFTNGGQIENKYSHIQEFSGYNSQNSTPVVISHTALVDKNNQNSGIKDKSSQIYNKVSPKNFQYEEFTDSEQLSNYPSGKLPSDVNSIINTEGDYPSNNKSFNSKIKHNNINITNNFNSNINVNTFSPVNTNIYDELSKKLVKPATSSYPKVGYFSEEIEPTSSVVNTEERSSRKKPNQNILEAENPEDLHFIQVEMLLQSKQISKKFENDQEKSPKISPSKLPTLSVIPIDEVDF